MHDKVRPVRIQEYIKRGKLQSYVICCCIIGFTGTTSQGICVLIRPKRFIVFFCGIFLTLHIGQYNDTCRAHTVTSDTRAPYTSMYRTRVRYNSFPGFSTCFCYHTRFIVSQNVCNLRLYPLPSSAHFKQTLCEFTSRNASFVKVQTDRVMEMESNQETDISYSL